MKYRRRKIYCENCGKELENDAKFCAYCGNKIRQQKEDKAIVLDSLADNDETAFLDLSADNDETIILDSSADNDKTEILKVQAENADILEIKKHSALEKGTILGNTYEIIEEIGSGGGGIVYRARHIRLQTDVVVKKIKEEVRGKIQIRQEADILKNLKHPFLPRVYDFIETDDGVYTVMDFIHGENLDEAVKKHGRFSQKQVKKWAKQLGEALKYLHSQNPPIIHSDIKPANIMLTKDGDVCLIDFNISLAMGGTMELAVGISAGFSPPEQYKDPALYARLTHNYTQKLFMAEERQKNIVNDKTEVLTENLSEYTKYIGRGIDTRSDIYSLGVTLYFLLTGIEPAVDFDKRIPIDQTNIEISEAFALILNKMMEFAPEDRYQDGGQFLYALQHIYELDLEYRAYRKKRRNLKLTASILLIVGAFLSGSGWGILQKEKNTMYNRNMVQAEEYIEVGNFEEASIILTDAMEIRPERIEAYSKEALRLYEMENYEECISYIVDVLENPNYRINGEEDRDRLGDMYYVLGNCYIEKEDYSNAELYLNDAIEQNGKNSLYYRDYAIALAKQGNVEKAEQELENAILLHLGEDSIYMVQGEIFYAKGENEEAEEQLLKAISFAVDDNLRKRAVLLCGKVYREMGADYIEREIELLEQEENRAGGAVSAMNISERLADAYARGAEIDEHRRTEYYEKAIQKFKLLYENGYSTRQMMENIAICYEQMGDFEQAEKTLTEMAEKYPGNYICYKRLAYLEADKQQNRENEDRDYHQMYEYYKKAKELYVDDGEDLEMQMLDNLIQELRDENWL